jgi:putative hydrolase of the HAD superfamily
MSKQELRAAHTWVFDLDNTLYPASCNLFDQIDRRIKEFVAAFLDVGPEEAYRLQKEYFRQRGSTLRGLMDLHGVDAGAYLDYVHDIDLSAVAASPKLERALARLDGRKIVFTMGTIAHARRVMDRLGVAHRFAGVFDIHAAGYRPKPDPAVYALLVERHGIEPAGAVMVEDIARNLKPAARLGMTTVWVRNDRGFSAEGSDGDHVHHVADDLAAWLEEVAQAGD